MQQEDIAMKKFFNEFKQFALRGNVLDLAVGVMMGAAFQGVVSSLTGNILSPLIGLFAKQDFATLSVSILGVPLTYGAFITDSINFIITAFVIFLIVKLFARISKKPSQPPAPATTKACPYCLSKIPLAATRCSACTSHLPQE